jgi:hypothetical protein
MERKLIFKPIEREVDLLNVPSLRETFQLENLKGDGYRLTRILACLTDLNAPLEARLVTEGRQVDDLLTNLSSVAPEKQFSSAHGFVVAKSYRLLTNDEAKQRSNAATPLILTQMVARLEGLAFTFTAPTVKADPDGLIELVPLSGDLIKLPEDLLAVLGWDWGLLQPKGDGWRCRVRLHGTEPQRSLKTELKVERAFAHTARTLTEPPPRFHERLTAARWRVVLRRSVPLFISILLIGGALASSSLNIAEDSQWRLLVLNAPPVLLVLFFCMREIPSIEIPPIPRRSKALRWHERVETLSASLPKICEREGSTSA